MPSIPTGLIPTGLIRKALIIFTAGLAARVWKDSSEKQPAAAQPEKPARPPRRMQTNAKRTATKASAKAAPRRAAPKAKQTPKTAQRSRPKAAKPRAAKPAPTSTTARTPMSTTGRTPMPTTARTPTPGIAQTPMPTTPQTQTPTIAQTPTPTIGTIAALARITNLRDQGALSNEEFAAAEKRILSAGTAAGESSEERSNVEAVKANVAAGGDLADVSRTVS